MVVIVVIAIIAGLLLPAIGGARTRARIASVVADISQLESAIAQFKASYGVEPPSSILLCENSVDWATYDPTGANQALVRTIWPQYDFANHDINGNGTPTTSTSTDGERITLTVGECLVFFLGGVNGNTVATTVNPLSNTSNNNNQGHIGPCTGFSKNPVSPFDRGGSRQAPLFEFLPGRFTDVDTDGFPEYRDPLPQQKNPYLYYSSYDGQGYAEATEFGGGGLTLAYRQDPNLTANVFWKPTSHQIVSPGFDGQYGYGGAYLTTGGVNLPAGSNGTTAIPPTVDQRVNEADNITNFSSGTLQP